jgi:hypothetical protein
MAFLSVYSFSERRWSELDCDHHLPKEHKSAAVEHVDHHDKAEEKSGIVEKEKDEEPEVTNSEEG